MQDLKKTDIQTYNLIKKEEERQKDVLEMIASENYASKAVMQALGSVLTNKYSEGFPKKRYYQGNQIADEVEILAQERAQKLFKVPYVNVQPLSGSPANSIVYLALLEYKDKILALSRDFGGHITHGGPLSLSARFFTPVHYTLGKDGKLDYDEIEKIALKERPKLIICGFTAYPRIYDFKRFGEIADKVGAYLMADVAHVAGLIAAGVHPSPAPYAHVITTTTHKTLRGPRGAMIMVTKKGIEKNPDLPKLIETAVIPGMQGGPHDNTTAAIAVALKEDSTPSFKKYAAQIIKNAKALAKELIKLKFDLVSGGTDNHLILIDLSNKKVSGAMAALALEIAGIVLNKNGVPYDTLPPYWTSGIRLGTPAITTRGMKEKDMVKIANWINEVVEEVKGWQLPENKEDRLKVWKEFKVEVAKNEPSSATRKKLLAIAKEIKSFTYKFPVP